MNLDEFVNLCGKTVGKTIVFKDKDNESEVRLETNGEEFYKVKFDELNVDEFKFRDESRSEQAERCDFVVFLKDGGKVVLFIEIKGSDLQKAWSQILNSMELLKNVFQEYKNYKKYATVVFSGNPLKTKIQSLQKKFSDKQIPNFVKRDNITLKYKEGEIKAG